MFTEFLNALKGKHQTGDGGSLWMGTGKRKGPWKGRWGALPAFAMFCF